MRSSIFKSTLVGWQSNNWFWPSTILVILDFHLDYDKHRSTWYIIIAIPLLIYTEISVVCKFHGFCGQFQGSHENFSLQQLLIVVQFLMSRIITVPFTLNSCNVVIMDIASWTNLDYSFFLFSHTPGTSICF